MSSTTESLPIAIPSRPSTPSPLDFRPRSDTLCSTSSTSTILQTPQTPPILGLLSWSPVSPSDDYPKPTGIRAKLSRSKSSFKDKTAKFRSTLNRSRTSLDSTVFTEPEEYSPPVPLLVNYFGAIPRELQVLILRAVATAWVGSGDGPIRPAREGGLHAKESNFIGMAVKAGGGPWTGEARGKRELIKLSRVSRGWQELCLDGQLWASLELTSMAPHLHPRTLQRILDSSHSYARRLNLRGMDALTFLIPLPNLTHLDLRGCRRLSSNDLCQVVGAPGLISVNLKGVQGVSAEVLSRLTSQHLEMLDVSRCRGIDMVDMAGFLRTPRRLKDLRVAGLKSGDAGKEFLQLAKVERLDLLGCDLRDEETELSPSITRLILSSNHRLTCGVFKRLNLPDLISLELAGMEMFRENRDATDFIDFLKSTPLLQRLDLDGASGGVNDRLLGALTRFCPDLAELHINYARRVTPEAMIKLIRGCPKLAVLEADNTSANNAVMIEFVKRRNGRINLQDCRAITPAVYTHVASATRPREGWEGHEALPFGYEATEMEGVVLKTFWSWRRVGIPRAWREARVQVEQGEIASIAPGKPSRRGSFWRDDDERDRCIIM